MPFVSNGQANIAWDEQGSGDPVLLVMGHRYPRQMWFRVAPVLAEEYRVITFDNRGAGQTTTAATSWTVEDMAADAVAVMDAAGVERAHVYGVSMGGGIAQVIALDYPDRVGALVLGCTASSKATPGMTKLQVLGKTLPHLFGGQVARTTAVAKVLLYGSAQQAALIDEDVAMLLSVPSPKGGAKIQQLAINGFVGTAARLSSITAPTLVIHGNEDVVVPLSAGRFLAEHIPGAELVVLDGAGHTYLTDKPVESNEVVRRFLEAHALADLAP